MAELPDNVREAFEAPNFWAPGDRQPGRIAAVDDRVGAHARRQDHRQHRARAEEAAQPRDRAARRAVVALDTTTAGYHSVSIQGRVVDTITGDQAEKDIDDLAQKYIGQSPYPWRAPGEQRVTYVIEPAHVHAMG